MKMRGKLFRIKYDSMRLYTEENSLIGKLFNHEISLFLSFTNILNAKKLELFHPLYGVSSVNLLKILCKVRVT